MKNQPDRTNRIITVFALMGFALYLIGCQANPTQNNQNSSRNSANSSNKTELPSPPPPPPPGKLCDKNPTLQELRAFSKGDKMPKELRDQFTNETIKIKSYEIENEKNTLTFEGFIYGNDALNELLANFDQYRSNECVQTILFKRAADGASFKWCSKIDAAGNCEPGKACAGEEPYVSYLIKERKFYIENETKPPNEFSFSQGSEPSVLILKGRAGAPPYSRDFNHLIAYLGVEMAFGCISTVELASADTVENLGGGFAFGLCPDPNHCNCPEGCKPCQPGCDKPYDTKKNANTNANGR